MKTLTKKNATDFYKERINALEKPATWKKEEIEELIQNGEQEVKEYGWYYTAVDYNSLIITIKYLMKKS